MSREKKNGIKVWTKNQAIDSLLNIQNQRYRDLVNQNQVLKESLKKTQDSLEELKDRYEKLKNEKFELEKSVVIYESQNKYNLLLEILKFVSWLILWWIVWALFSKQYSWRFLLGIPFCVLYVICLIISRVNKK